jgi:hypothetical protein
MQDVAFNILKFEGREGYLEPDRYTEDRLNKNYWRLS